MADYTQAEYDALKKAVAQGVLMVQYGDKTVTYRSLDEMMRILDVMAKEINPNKGSGRKLAQFSKGLK